jgi:hypothetical protein
MFSIKNFFSFDFKFNEYRDIILVGNGFKKDKKMKEKIEKFDCIIRFNIPILERDDELVGKKTTHIFSFFDCIYGENGKFYDLQSLISFDKVNFYITSPSDKKKNKLEYIDYIYDTMKNKKGKYFTNEFYEKNNFICLLFDYPRHVINFDFFYEIIKNSNGKLPFWKENPTKNCWITSGLFAIITVILSEKIPYIYGFQLDLENTYYSSTFDNFSHNNISIINDHDYIFERKYIKLLLEEKKIYLLE